MAQTKAQLLLAAALAAALLLLLPAHAAVTSVRIAKMVSGVKGSAGVPHLGDNVNCEVDKGTKEYTCTTPCIATASGFDTPVDGYCYPSLRTACDGKWCSMKVSIEAELDASPSSTAPRISVSANPIYYTKLLTTTTDTSSRPHKVVFTVQVGTAVSVGQFSSDPDSHDPLQPFILFTATQGRGSGMTAAVQMTCRSAAGAKLTFGTPTVDCEGKGTVEATAVATGCPNVFEPHSQGEYLALFNGALPGTSTSRAPTFADQYHGSAGLKGPSTVLATTAAGRVQATFKRSWYWHENDALPAGVTSIKVGHRLHPASSTWTLSSGAVNYVDADNDGFGAACDCDDSDWTVHTGCARRLQARRISGI